MRPSATAARNPYRAALRQLWPVLALTGAFSAAINILMLTGSIYMLQVYDRVLGSGSIPTLQGLFAVVVLLYVFLGVYEFLRVRLLSRASYRLDAMMGRMAFRQWLGAGIAGRAAAEGQSGGQPLRDLETVRGFLASPAVLGLFDMPWIPLYLIIVFVIHPVLGLVTLGGSAVVVAVALLNQAVTRKSIAEAMAKEGAERAFTDQSRRNAEVIAALGMQEVITERWRQMHVANFTIAQIGAERSEGFTAFSKSFRMLLQSCLLTAGAYLAIGQEISSGMIVASSIIAGRALAPVDQVIGQWRAIGRAREAHRRCLAGFDQDMPEPMRFQLPVPTGVLQVARLTKFAPGRQTQPGGERARILSGVSFNLDPGDGLGVIGNSASGKSTLARLIVGAWTADSGEVRLDGATLDQWAPADLGRHIGYLPQALEMLPGSIRDNIARFDPLARDDQVIEAARIAGVHEMILNLPSGYTTILGQDSQILSGGQIQRLGLARAIFGAPRLIVLDEPNSNLDSTGDEALARAITTMRAKGAVVIVMAHRPSAIAAVNKVLVLQSGTVVRFGTKEEVMGPQQAAVGPAAPPLPVPPPPDGQVTAGMVGPAAPPFPTPAFPVPRAAFAKAGRHPR